MNSNRDDRQNQQAYQQQTPHQQQPQQQDQQQPQAPGRLQLNLGFTQTNNFAADVGRAFPTTPSTFPQPIFPNQYGQRETWGNATPTGPNGYGNASYFMNNPYPTQYQNMPGGLQSPTSATTTTPGGFNRAGPYNDGTNGLVHQFSHQNLGGNSPRSGSPYGRQQSPTTIGRPKTAGSAGQHQQSNLSANGQGMLYDDELPPRNPERYADNVYKRAKASQGTVSAFFKENVQRAKDRNQRAKELEAICARPDIPDSRKDRQRLNMRRAETQYLRFLRTKEKPQNFQTIKIIGKGAFGEVKLVQRKNDGKIYALKSLVKSEMFKRDQLAHVRSERDILAESDSPWVVKLYTTFQDSSFLYMLMEFLPGGDLMTMLIKYEVFSEDITRFYMAELVTAIEAVHKLGFIHRDIKPDNILLDRYGHIKLTDFGLSTGFHKEHDQKYYQQLMEGKSTANKNRANRQSVNIDQIQLTVSNRDKIQTWRKSRRQLAYSTVGTPDYIAPEIFTGKGYDFGCDWWSVGTIMYECMVGWPPFCAEETNETYRKIVEWKRHFAFPPDCMLSETSVSFMRGLICDSQDRLGHLGGAHEIKSHPFFSGVDWSTLRKIRAPFEPKLTSNVDTQYFPIDEIPQQDQSELIRDRERQERVRRGEDPEESAEMSLPFIGYTFRRFEGNR